MGGAATRRVDVPATPHELLDLAERMFAERGIEHVALTQIVAASRQRNRSALHYHFGSREGVLSALLDRRLAPINAKAETAATSRMFQGALKRARCLVPATGFYEWKAVPGQKRKQPWYLRLRGGGLFGFAGLYTPAGPQGDQPATCAIITTTANPLVALIHGRMPVILAPEAEGLWLDEGLDDPARLLPVLRPLAASLMEAWPVSTRVSSPASEGPALAEPLSG